MSINNKNYDEIERERVAKTRQEIVENRRELASCLYQYNGPVLKGQGCMLLPGDYMMLQNNKVTSSRGAQIPISDEQLSDMLDEKIMTGVFDMDDLNADNFDSQLDAVLDEIYRQSTYQDASYYMTNDNNSYGLASYVSEQDPDEIIIQVECENSEFKVLPEIVDKTVVSQLRECTYNEFNPGALEMRAELNKTSSDMKNKTNMYNEMMNEYLSNGRNNIKEPGEILKDKDMSAKDKLFAYKDAQESLEEEQQNNQLEVQENIEDIGYVPKAFKRFM